MKETKAAAVVNGANNSALFIMDNAWTVYVGKVMTWQSEELIDSWRKVGIIIAIAIITITFRE